MMVWIWLLALAAESVPSDDAVNESTAQTLKIDILVRQPPQKCDRRMSDEIVVCANMTDNESQRLRPIANAVVYDKDESAADFGISDNARMAVEAESEELQQGIIAKRAMVKLKIKF
jgi:hypothetical protein